MRSYRTVLVTGASRGLGAALARELAARGYTVVMAARSADDLRAVAEPLQADHGERVQWMTLDLRDNTALMGAVAAAEARVGPLDVLVNNAGIGTYRPLCEWSAQDIADCVQVNLTAPMLLSRAALPGFVARRHGMIVNIASDLSRRHLAQMAPYVATKADLLGFAGSLLREVKASGVKVSTVLPGIIDTAFNGAQEGTKQESWSLRPAVLAARVVDLLELPEHVVIDELTIHPMQQDF